MTIPLRQEYDPNLAAIRGWLAFFSAFTLLSFLAFLRSAMATVVAGRGGGLIALIIAALLLVAWIGLLRRWRWSYFLFLAVGFAWLAMMAIAIVSAPDQMLVRDWAFDLPALVELTVTAGWLGYFLWSRRVYSVFFGPATA